MAQGSSAAASCRQIQEHQFEVRNGHTEEKLLYKMVWDSQHGSRNPSRDPGLPAWISDYQHGFRTPSMDLGLPACSQSNPGLSESGLSWVGRISPSVYLYQNLLLSRRPAIVFFLKLFLKTSSSVFWMRTREI